MSVSSDARRTLSGPELRAARQNVGLTQKLVADRMGVTRPRVVNLEKAENIEPTTVGRYLRALERLR